jgi:hypothetical protein
MFARYYNLVLMAAWLLIAAVVFDPLGLAPENLRRRLGGVETTLVGVLAVVLAVYNFARWWARRSIDRGRSGRCPGPLSVRMPDREPEEYVPNPELDFLKVPDADKPPPGPSADGERKG